MIRELRATKVAMTGVIAALILLVPALATARPEAPRTLCMAYPDAEVCAGRVAECWTCHTATEPPSWNGFGEQVLGALVLSGDYPADLTRALTAVESLDGDGDGIANIDEILAGTDPGDANDGWPYCRPEEFSGADGVPVPGSYDFARAYRRASVQLCGHSPDAARIQLLDSGALDRAQSYAAVHDLVATCLDSAYFRDTAVPRMADARIQPLVALSADSPIGFVAADYAWDYRLFAYVLTGDRDVRDLLLADYHVQVDSDGTLYPVQGVQPPRPDLAPQGPGGQPLEPQYRAGMLTTQWFLLNVASALPRTAAARAYNAYLGTDIAQLQGIRPIPGEPVDIDGAGVAAPGCASCHSTLDPLSYAFSVFNGFPIDPTVMTGTYNPDRPYQLMPDWNDNQSAILGQPVANLREWAERAVASEDFQRTVGTMAFQHLFGREPTIAERPSFNAAWRALPADGWSFNALIHRLVDFSAYGGSR